MEDFLCMSRGRRAVLSLGLSGGRHFRAEGGRDEVRWGEWGKKKRGFQLCVCICMCVCREECCRRGWPFFFPFTHHHPLYSFKMLPNDTPYYCGPVFTLKITTRGVGVRLCVRTHTQAENSLLTAAHRLVWTPAATDGETGRNCDSEVCMKHRAFQFHYWNCANYEPPFDEG